MSQIRRVTRSATLLKARRPATSRPQTVSADTATARLATVTQLFPKRSMPETTQITNIFADLAEEGQQAHSPAARARARAMRHLPVTDLPVITNIFAEDCDDLSPEAEAQMVARLAARPRKMALARAHMAQMHEEQAAQSALPLREMGGIAAGVGALLSMLHIFPVPNV